MDQAKADIIDGKIDVWALREEIEL